MTTQLRVKPADRASKQIRTVPVLFKWQESVMDHYSGVYLSGTFNNWQRVPVKFCDNEYIESIDLLPGKYEFKFFVDGEWKHDPKLNNIPNKLGSHNNVINVTKDDSSLCISCTESVEGAAKTFNYKELGGTLTTGINEPSLSALPRPPSSKWITEQLDRAYTAMNSTYRPPSNWSNVTDPLGTFYFPNINLVFTGIPKIGSTHWKATLLRAEGVHLTDPHRAKGLDQQYRVARILKLGGVYGERIKSAKSVVVLRNPWVRAVSAYRQKLSAENTLGPGGVNFKLKEGSDMYKLKERILREERNIPRDRYVDTVLMSPTFEEFIRYSIKEGGIDESHFWPQYQSLSANTVRYDYIIPMEFVDQMSKKLFKDLGLNVTLPMSYDGQNDPRLQNSTVKAREFFSSLDPDLVEQFYKIYQLDFMLLDYSNFTHPNFPLPNKYH